MKLVLMLIFVLPTKKRLVVSLWAFFQISQQPQGIRKNEIMKIFVDAWGFLKEN